MEKIGVIDGSGNIVEATIQEFIHEDPSAVSVSSCTVIQSLKRYNFFFNLKEATIRECAQIEHADPCEKSFQMLGCVMKLCKDH